MQENRISLSSILLDVQHRAPELVLRLDLDPGDDRPSAPPVLRLTCLVPTLSRGAVDALLACKGLPCDAELWPESEGPGDLELYLNHAADPLVITSDRFKSESEFRSRSDSRIQVSFLRGLAEEYARDSLTAHLSERELRERLLHHLRQGIVRSERSEQFFSGSGDPKAVAAAAEKRVYHELLAILERMSETGPA